MEKILFRRTTNKALMMISFTYIISLLVWPPWIIGWPYIEGIFNCVTMSLIIILFYYFLSRIFYKKHV